MARSLEAEMFINKPKAKLWAGLIVIIAVCAAASLICISRLNRSAEMEINGLGNMRYADALRKIQTNGDGRMKLDDTTMQLVVNDLPPGKGTGFNPHFQNIGNTPVIIFAGDANKYYILGKAQVLYHREGKWQVETIVENGRYVAKAK